MRNIIISGGSEGLGFDISKTFSSDWNVISISRSNHENSQSHFYKCDVSNFNECEKTIKQIISDFKSIDVLINNAGIWIEGELDSNDAEQIERVVGVNLLGPIFLSKVAIPFMKEQGSGTIININSQAGLYAKADRTVYTATKWGLTGFSRSLRPELARYGIRVIDVFPGKMNTHLFSNAGVDKDLSDSLETKQVAKLIKFAVELPDDVVVTDLGVKNISN